MIVINLFGAPGAGKSTGAAYIFSELKLAGVNAELVTEFAKDKVWEDSKGVFKSQPYIFGKQNFRLERLREKVDVVVTDSPIFLSILYNNQKEFKYFEPFVKEVFDSYNNHNYFVNRVKPYNPKGRFQTSDESDEIAKELTDLLKDWDIDFVAIEGNKEGYNKIVSEIIEELKTNEDQS